ncbi:TPR-like protein [Rhizopogon salebrosus TDB-379]|nr:TPR-like protein [Rhizopogon salebrosus TDB-379]
MADNITQSRAVTLHHSDPSLSLNNAPSSPQARSEQLDVPPSLDEVIDLHRAALSFCPTGDADQSLFLDNVIGNLQDGIKQQGVKSNLDVIIGLNRAAVAICPPDDSDRYEFLHDLAENLLSRFKQHGTLSDLDEAIDLHQAALALCPPGHHARFQSLNNLATSLQSRFKQQHVLSDLDEIIDLHRAALVFCPPGHPDQSSSLSNLATSLQHRFEQQGVLSDLSEAIDLHQAALPLHPPGDFNHSMSLNNLATGLRARFKHEGVLSDLDQAIEIHQAALALCPPGHVHQSLSLNNLAISLQDRFEQRGVLSDLDEAIEHHQAALALRPHGHPDQSTSLNNLATSLQARFEQGGVLSDLSEVINLHRAALALRPPGHSSRSISLRNLALNLQNRFKQQGILSDLDEAIDLHQAALALLLPGHPDQSMSLNNLATCLQDRFEQRGAPSDLDEAINFYQAALKLCPPSHSDQCVYLNNLAGGLHSRFRERGMLPDLDEAIGYHRAALGLRPSGHSDRSSSLSNLASKAAKSWAISAGLLRHSSTLVAYKTALRFLDDWQHVAGLSSSSHHFDLVRKATSSLAMDAFSYSVHHGALTTAVELVEQGRAVFWTQLARFHTPLDDISMSGDIGKDLAAEFKELSFRLRNMLEDPMALAEDQTAQIRKLTMQRDDVISRIRTLPDFSRFLLPPLFSDLQQAAQDGPVIIVNASQYSCDALIILSSQGPVHVPLNIARAEVSELSTNFRSLIDDAGSSDNGLEASNIIGILRELWERVVGPIVKALRDLIPRGSRIWWCPTADFTLLPLHAAGPYARKSHNLSHFYISSYTPTLATLIRARQQVARDATSTPHFVAIGQGKPNEGKELPRVGAELCDVAHRVAPILPFTALTDSDATVQRALDALSQHQWLHLACHGMPNREKPFDSSFAMRDGPMTITNIIRPRLQKPEFAFLSACHTTVGHASSPDEAIHLAAAMQFSGFRSVIGSMWSVDDEAASQLVSAFYENMLDRSGKLHCTRAAVALHETMKKLRKEIPFEQQIVFIHIGV